MMAVWKADKVQVRVCLDPTRPECCDKSHFRMPTLDDILPVVKRARVFSLLDVKDGFMHIRLSEVQVS